MNTSKCHYCLKGEQREILIVVFTRFCWFSEGNFGTKSPISSGRNVGLKPIKLLNQIGYIGDKQDSFQFLEASFFQSPGLLILSRGMPRKCFNYTYKHAISLI